MMTEILYEDGDVLVVYKPAGLATQTAKMGQPDVVSELKNYLQRTQKLLHGNRFRQRTQNLPPGAREDGGPYLGVIHRLDQPVEGLLVFAKNKNAAASLSGQLKGQETGGDFCKNYYAVLCGIPAQKQGELKNWLYKSRENRAVVVDRPEAGPEDAKIQRAVLRYHILQIREEYNLALADIRLETGRFHQIRAQAAHAGTPLLGDRKYGTEETEEKNRELGISHVALCAYCLEFRHPVLKKEMHFQIKPKNKAFTYFSQL